MHPVINLPLEYWVHDFTRGPDPNFQDPYGYSIGKYDEVREGMYVQDIFGGVRKVHMGIDIGAPEGEPVHLFSEGTLHSQGVNPEDGSYGPTIITKHDFEGRTLWALFGHLSVESLNRFQIGDTISEGEVFAWVGSEEVNGGWKPHLHLQLSWQEPEGNDMPGVVTIEDREQALLTYPDPRLVLGPIY